MFYIIGIGLSINQITKEATEILNIVSNIYLDNYTNILSEGDIKELERTIQRKIIPINRNELEVTQEFLKDDTALLVIGNPFSATTHFTLIKDAKKKRLEVKVIPGISIFNYRGTVGLSEYKFGKTISIVYPIANYKPTSFYDSLIDNLKIGAHTLCLLDIKTQENKFMTVKDACSILSEIDINKILNNKECIGLFGLGSKNQKTIVFKFMDYNNINIDIYPQSLIICGELNEFERDGLNEFTK